MKSNRKEENQSEKISWMNYHIQNVIKEKKKLWTKYTRSPGQHKQTKHILHRFRGGSWDTDYWHGNHIQWKKRRKTPKSWERDGLPNNGGIQNPKRTWPEKNFSTTNYNETTKSTEQRKNIKTWNRKVLIHLYRPTHQNNNRCLKRVSKDQANMK